MPQFAKWYSCNVDPLGRSAGRSAVSAAAYRIGAELHDERTQTTHDYTRRGGIETSFIVTPANAPDWAHDPQKLWNEAERVERKCNSRTAREVKLALPASVDVAEREKITRAFAEHLAERYGVVAMVALHEPSKQGDDRNYHAHILITTRRMDADGFGVKTRELDDWKTGKQEIRHIREYAAETINATLAEVGSEERVSPDSYETRGVEQIPGKHLGHKASAKERRGERSERGDLNREIAERNQQLEGLIQEREELEREISETRSQAPEARQEPEKEATPSPEPGATHWQERIAAEPEGEGGSAPISSSEPGRGANSSIRDPVNISLARQITTYGEVQHKGLIKSWVEHALDWAYEFKEDFAYAWEILRGGEPDLPKTAEPEPQEREGFWQKLVGGGRSAEGLEPPQQPTGDPPPAKKKHFWQRFVEGGKPAEPAKEQPIAEGIHPEESSGNRFQQLTSKVKGQLPEKPAEGIERPRSGLDYWRSARGRNLSTTPSKEIDNDINNDIDKDHDMER